MTQATTAKATPSKRRGGKISISKAATSKAGSKARSYKITLSNLYGDDGRVHIVHLAQALGEPASSLARVVNMTPRAITKNPTSKRAQPAIIPLANMLQHAVRVLGTPKNAMIWLRTPTRDLEDKSPLDVAKEGHANVVIALLKDIATGQPG